MAGAIDSNCGSLAGDRSFGREENLLARDHAQQITTNDVAFLVIPVEAGIQRGRESQ
jgi:hypothetical protein